MAPVFFLAGIWLLIAVVAAIIAYHLDISIALVEIIIGVAAGAVADHFFGKGSLGSTQPWLQFLASIGAVLLTFLAGAELDPAVMRTKLKEVSVRRAGRFCCAVRRGNGSGPFPPGMDHPRESPRARA